MEQDNRTGSDQELFCQKLKAEATEPEIIDAGQVFMVMAVEGKGMIPVPIPAVFQQLFGIIGHLDKRVIELETKLKIYPNAGESSIITLN